CWGAGPIGSPDSAVSHHPLLVAGGVQFTSIAAGDRHTCGLAAGGTAYCWGTDGDLGVGTTASSAIPVAVVGGHIFQNISVGSGGTCAMAVEGVYCWGVITGVDSAFGGSLSPIKVQGQ